MRDTGGPNRASSERTLLPHFARSSCMAAPTARCSATGSVTGQRWSVFRNTVLADPRLAETGALVTYWDQQMTGQTARRALMPAHYFTGALDPHIAVVRQVLVPRVDVPQPVADGLPTGPHSPAGHPARHTRKWARLAAAHQDANPASVILDEPVDITIDGSRTYPCASTPYPRTQRRAGRKGWARGVPPGGQASSQGRKPRRRPRRV
jgi:hypothetical protein